MLIPLFPRLAIFGALVLSAGLSAAEPAEELPAAPAAPVVKLTAAERLALLKEKYGEELIYRVDENLKLIFASSTDEATLDEVQKRLSSQAVALKAGLFPDGLNDYVTVVLPKEWKGSSQGLYNPEARSIIAKTPGAQLNHEFTHALHIDHMQAMGQVYHENWIIEGLAAFCETTDLVNGELVPLPNHRTKIIVNLAKGGKAVPWATYLTWDQRAFMKAPGNHYSQARYMFIYLQSTGHLAKWYKTYVENFAADRTGALAFEKVFAKPLADIEKDWLAWLVQQPVPETPPPAAPPAASP
jgi:hypothetical protein